MAETWVDLVKKIVPNTGFSDEEIGKQIKADRVRVSRQFPGILPPGTLGFYHDAVKYGAAASLLRRISDSTAAANMEITYQKSLDDLRDAVNRAGGLFTYDKSLSLPEAIEDGGNGPKGEAGDDDEINELYAAMDEAIKAEDEIRKINAAIAAHGYGYCWAWVDADDLLKGVWLCPPLEMGYNPKIVPYNGAEQEKHLSEHWDQAVPDYCRDVSLVVSLIVLGRELFGDVFVSAYNEGEADKELFGEPAYGGAPMYAAGFKGGLDQFPYPLPEAVARAFVSALGKEQEKEKESRREAAKTEARIREAVSNRPSNPGSFNVDKMEEARENAKRLWQFAQEAALIREAPPTTIKPGTLMMLDKEGYAVPCPEQGFSKAVKRDNFLGSLIGVYNNGEVEIHKDEGHNRLTPSSVIVRYKARPKVVQDVAIDRKVPARKPQTPYRILGKTQLDFRCPRCENGRLRYTEDPYTMGLKYVCDTCKTEGGFALDEIEEERLRQGKSDNKK